MLVSPSTLENSPLLSALTGAARSVVQLLVAEDSVVHVVDELPPPMPMSPTSRPAAVLLDMTRGFAENTDVNHRRSDVAQLLHASEQRAELIDQLSLAHDIERLGELTATRDHLEREVLIAVREGQLPKLSTYAMWKDLDGMVTGVHRRVKSGAVSIRDVIAALEKADYALSVGDGDMVAKFANTSPQGREVARRLVVHLARAVNAAEGKAAAAAEAAA